MGGLCYTIIRIKSTNMFSVYLQFRVPCIPIDDVDKCKHNTMVFYVKYHRVMFALINDAP